VCSAFWRLARCRRFGRWPALLRPRVSPAFVAGDSACADTTRGVPKRTTAITADRMTAGRT